MVTQETVWQEIWPVVEALLEATLAEDEVRAAGLLAPDSEAGVIMELFGVAVFDIMLKTVLGRERMALTRAIETDGGRHVHVELVWPDPEQGDNSYTAADLTSVKMQRLRKEWRVVAINPAAIDFPLTEARAQAVLLTSKVLSDEQRLSAEPWLLPVALFAGNLQIPLQQGAMQDDVERLLLPGMQHRTYGILSLIAGRRMWRDFKKRAGPQSDRPAAWAAAAEFLMSEQMAREATQAGVAKNYEVSLTHMLPCVKRIKSTLQISGLDERYSPLGRTQVVVREKGAQ